MNKEDVLGAFLLVNNPIVLSEEETKDVQKAIKQLQQENQQLQEELKFTIGIVEHNRIINKKNREIHQLKIQIFAEKKEVCNNWNKLKKFLEDWKENEKYCYLASSPIDRCRKDIYEEILDKMQELEQGSDKK